MICQASGCRQPAQPLPELVEVLGVRLEVPLCPVHLLTVRGTIDEIEADAIRWDEAREGLYFGDPCPVCGQQLPDDELDDTIAAGDANDEHDENDDQKDDETEEGGASQ